MHEGTEDRAFEEDPAPAAAQAGPLIVDLEGYEGPLDVLLALTREHKVDITKISILALAEQYLAFIERARDLRLEVAADYLVMAAWLAYLKSRLLLPEAEGDDEPTAREMAAMLAFRLARLEAMRTAGEALMTGNRAGRDVFYRGAPEGIRLIRHSRYQCSLFELLKAYAEHREVQGSAEALRLRRDAIYPVEQAIERLSQLLGALPDWSSLRTFLPPGLRDRFAVRSATASTFAAALELTKQGKVRLRQGSHFGPIYVRRVSPP